MLPSLLFDIKYITMNIYLRYFDNEILVSTADEAIDFLKSIDEIGMDANLEREVRAYLTSNVFYPKRYKIRPRVYFIIIKTEAATMQDFKEKKAVHAVSDDNAAPGRAKVVSPVVTKLNEQCEGWYEGTLDFKRVLLSPNGKFQYQDTHFVAACKAVSGMDCYNRICEYLRERVDNRSQFPSAKGKNFHYRYLGMWK